MELVSRARGTFFGQRTGGATHRRAVFIGFGLLAGGAAGARERSLKSSHFVAPLSRVSLGNADGTFQPARYFGWNGAFLASGDLNGDGKLDLVLASGSVVVLLYGGDRSFQHEVSIAPGSFPAALAVGDLNGDGKLDLAATDGYSNGILILLGNGDGSFQPPIHYPAGNTLSSLALADFNGDGNLDLVVVSPPSNTVSILIGNGDGTFQAPVSYHAGPIPWSVAVADFKHDGKLDLAVTALGSNGVAILLGNGDGTFQAPVYTAGGGGRVVAAGDFNRDGKPDLAVAGAPSMLSILLGNGDGTFQPPVNYAVGPDPVAMTVGDFTGNGKQSLAVDNEGTSYAPFASSTVSVLLGNGDGTFQPAVNYTVGAAPEAVVIGDFNGDRKLDLAVMAAYSNLIAILLGNGDGTFQSPVNFAVMQPANALAVGDFNSNGKPDLAVGRYAMGISILTNTTR